jgi:hypothetical protein
MGLTFGIIAAGAIGEKHFSCYPGAEPPGGEATVKEYRTRPQLASEMLGIAAEWLPGRRIRMVGDSEYSQYVG